MSDQVRIYIAVISLGVALAAWPLYEPNADAAPRPTRLHFAVSSLLLGILAGFRPEMVVSLGPLLLIAALRGRMRFRHYLVNGLALAAGMAPWLIMLLVRVGGIGEFPGHDANLLRRSSEWKFGIIWSRLERGVEDGHRRRLWWASLEHAGVSWMPAALLVHWGKVREGPKRTRFFLLVWFLSLFLFSIAVHIAASGHALGFIPVLCLAGGWVLYSVGRTRGRLLMIPCVILALTLNVTFFFKPYAREVREASYHTITGVSAINEATLEKITT